MPRSRRNENCISGSDFPGFPVNLDEPAAGENEVNLLAGFVVVALSAPVEWQRRFREALIFNRCVG